ncbi:DUF2953 domain-containing protein [Clostridium sp. D2Q-11]|uniref:DUF2953 domain-containing protein n=1 Tax=Anaeromonas frigoriresistens TaxID=2683708 RepID=A0A942ZAN9_9FIRM|nr:DUF2953 domain-containing protein [Anaeromonas frigoriresistens]MBS4539960.1 DUF2953 domain-containing protein [Anaeromonas frigoriresistens]
MYILIVFLIAIMIFINIPFFIQFKMSRKHDDDNLHIYVKLTERIKIIQLEIPYIDMLISNEDINFNITRDIETKKRSLNKKRKKISLRKIIDLFKKLYHHQIIFNSMKSFKNYLLKKIKIQELYWETKIGYNDAAVCAISSGILWSIKSMIFSYVYSKYKLIKFKYDVNTIYNENVFEIDFNCIIQIKIIYIIKAILFSILSIVKGGELDA